MEMKLNRERLRDKILGCWIGKNIGGTMGTPFEGKRMLLDIPGYTTPKGEPLANDDLDLQLVWLRAMEQVGPRALTANILGDYWMTYISPHWNEYGISKCNMAHGLLPPASGEFCNDDWRHSNGAWIRSEIWACLAPGFPNVAIKYAIMDASIDHGVSEGTYAEIFTAAMESLAFGETDIRTVVEMALEFIPEGCRLAQCVRLVLREYDQGTPYRDVRNMLVEQTADMGWFQAPANVSFAVIGMIYGEGDFEKSLIYAINCGDDADCTAATCGAVLGILCGAAGIPAELKDYIGDRIITKCINASYDIRIPATCTELTERVLKMIPTVLMAHDVYVEYTDGASDYEKEAAFSVLSGYAKAKMARSRYSFEIDCGYFVNAVVEYDKEPVIGPGQTFRINVTFRHRYMQTCHCNVDVLTPEGWTAEYPKSVFFYYNKQRLVDFNRSNMTVTLTAGDRVDARNDAIIRVISPLSPTPLLIPLALFGA